MPSSPMTANDTNVEELDTFARFASLATQVSDAANAVEDEEAFTTVDDENEGAPSFFNFLILYILHFIITQFP